MKRIILCSIFLLVFVFSGIAFAAENPFQGLTQDQIVQKYFEGRQPDLIEGVWLVMGYAQSTKPWIIIKSNLITPIKTYETYDYLMVEYTSSTSTEIVGIRKTIHPSCFERGRLNFLLRFLSQNTLHYAEDGLHNFFFTRIYPNEVK